MRIVYRVPYEGGFSSGEHTFDNPDEAVESAKTSYGDITLSVEIPMMRKGYLTEEYAAYVKELR